MKILIFGQSGTGKTKVVNHIAESIRENGGWFNLIEASKWANAPLNDDSVEYDDNATAIHQTS